MATAEEIEHFITEQKSKLARDRQQLDRRDALPPQVPNRAQNGYPPRSQEPTYSRKGDPPSPRPLPRGSYERVRSRLNEERRQEYNKTLDEHKLALQMPGMEDNGFPGLRERDSAKLRMRQQRNQEYNDYIRQKEDAARRRRGLRGGQSEPDVSTRATNLPEPLYNDRLPPPAPRDRDLTFGERPLPPRQGWKTPIDNYDDIVRRRREEEARYRQDDPYYARQGGMRPAYSDPHLNKSYEEEDRVAGRRLDYLDQEYDTRKVRFRDEAIRGGAASSRDFNDRPKYPPRDSRDQYYGESRIGRHSSVGEADGVKSAIRPGARSAPIDDAGTGLRLGGESTASAQQRRKEQYRKELEQQMAEAREAKRREKLREKESDLAVNASGAIDPEKHRDRIKGLPPQEGKALPTTVPKQQPLQRPAYLDDPPPNVGLSKAYARSQPSSYLEQPLDLGAYPTSQLNPNDPYVYYGLRDPLDPETARTGPMIGVPQMGYGQGIPGGAPMVPVGAAGAPGVHGGPGVGGSIYQPRGPEFSKQDMAALRGDSAILNYIGDEALSPRHKKIDPKSYQQELLEQMKENDAKKRKAKMEEDAYNRKLEEEIRSYNPWGKGGGGAPMKDVKGNVVADLKQLHLINEDPGTSKLYAEIKSPTPRPSDNTGSSQQAPQSTQPPSLSLAAAFADDSKPSHARGKIFNDDPQEIAQQKTAQDAYKDFLQRQVEEKKRKEAEERDKIRQEEERENRRIEEERQKMQREFEVEQEKQRKKEEEARLRNEELAKEAENKRKEQERLRREADGERLDQLRQKEEDDRRRRDAENDRRIASPPIPALRPKNTQSSPEPDPDDRPIQPAKDRRSVSPPLPASRSRVGDNQDVIHALSAMRRQLRDEQSRIQQQLQNKQYDDYDKQDRNRRRTPQVDVFEMARNKEAVYPRRASAEPVDPKNLMDFTDLKNKGGRSRQEFRRHYPENPQTTSTLEEQQNALIHAQEEKLNAIRRAYENVGRTTTERDMPGMAPKDIGFGRESPSMPLPSESAFVNANTGETEIPSPLGYKPSSARQRRRGMDSPPLAKQADPMGSVTSFDVDALAKRNKERLQKLKHLEDGDSLADPDEVLKRFMMKSSHDRPPSATSQDAWLRPSVVDA